MAYQTGSATSASNLKTLLESFATSNGWTDTSGVLSQGASYIRLTALDSERLQIEGDTDGLFTAGACPQSAKVFIESSVWPVTYRFFAFSSPEFLCAVLQYDVSRVQMLWAGSIAKYGTWTGGNWFGASHGDVTDDATKFYLTNATAGGTFYSDPTLITKNAPGAPFWETRNFETFGGGYQALRASFVHAVLDGQTWPGAGADLAWPSWPGNADPLHVRQPNVWNGESVLLPMHLFFPRADTFYSPIGHLDRMRAVRIDDYNIGDIITITPDKWMVFPWHKKNIDARNGGFDSFNDLKHTGTFGVAIEYDGP